MQSADGTPRSVSAALDEVSRWRTEAEARGKAEVAEVDQEIESLRTAIANLEQQIEALRKSRDAAAKREGRVSEEAVRKSYDAIFSALHEQMDAVKARAEKVRQVEDARKAALAATFQDPALAKLLSDYQKMTPEVIAAIPESYRDGVLAQHQANSAKLREHVEKATAGASQVEAAPVTVDVVFAVDMADGQPQVIWVVVPVEDAVHSAWAARAEDAQSWLAARVVQGVHAACAVIGIQGSPAFGPHQGLLALEMDLTGASGAVSGVFEEQIAKALAGAQELAGARIVARPRQVLADHLLPPEEPQAQETVNA
jgi:hypothetical protein